MLSIFSSTGNLLQQILQSIQLDHAALATNIRPCKLSACRATCCHDGVQLSEEDAQLIESLTNRYAKQLQDYGIRPEQQKTIKSSQRSGWKTSSIHANRSTLADDFPRHFPQTRCVFLDSQHRCCLQRLATDQGKHPWYFKPHTCWIHPLLIQKQGENHLLTIVNKDNDPQKSEDYPGYSSSTHCGREDNAGIPAKDALQNELKMLGLLADRDFLGELNAPEVDWYD